MKILFLGINYKPELTGIGKYSGEMAPWLALNKLHHITFITAPPYYPDWRIGAGYSAYWYKAEQAEGVDIIRCPLYVPAEVTTLKRILHLLSFAISSCFALLAKITLRPDVVVVVVPTLFCAPFALLYAKLSGAKSIIHIQDYELDAMLGLQMNSSLKQDGLVARCAKSIERFLLRRFDRVSTISYSMLALAEAKGVDAEKLIFFPNWVDTSFITPDACDDIYRQQWGIAQTDKVVLYSGNIGNKQGLELVLDAAAHFAEQPSVKFVVVGQGAYRSTLELMAQERQLHNLQFRDLVPYADLPSLMAMADVHLVVQKRGAADVVLPSKLTSILSAGGHALITAEPATELGLLCDKYPGIATCVMPECVDSFVGGLQELLLKDTRVTNTVARGYALAHLNKDAVLEKFNQELTGLNQ